MLVSAAQLNSYLNETVNLDLENRLKYFKHRYIDNQITHILALENKKIVGMLAYQQSFEHPNFIHLEFVTVDPEYQNQKISSNLLNEFVQNVKTNNCGVAIGSLSQDGRTKVYPKIKQLCEKYGIELKVKD
jgi:ribosomal protein S18 acetylase RimI-like enzyme